MPADDSQPTPPPPIPPGPPPPASAGRRKQIDWMAILIPIAFAAISILVIGFIVYAISGKEGVLTSLADEKIARGLITFLITLATVAIAIILTLSAIISDPAVVKDRFTLGKEVLSILIGVLGTIVGFYFGSAVSGQAQPLHVVSALVTNEQPKKGDTTTIVAFIAGGKSPYTYSITFTPPAVPNAKDLSANDGTIKYDVQVPLDLKAETTEAFVIDVKDSDGKTITYNKEGAKKFVMKPQ
jgi:hypothetical protein